MSKKIWRSYDLSNIISTNSVPYSTKFDLVVVTHALSCTEERADGLGPEECAEYSRGWLLR
jgi:hypothetical protein